MAKGSLLIEETSKEDFQSYIQNNHLEECTVMQVYIEVHVGMICNFQGKDLHHLVQ